MEKAEEIAGRYRDAGQYMARMAEAGLMQNTKESMEEAMDVFRAARAREEEDAGKYVMSDGKRPRPLAIAENAARWFREAGALEGKWRWNDFSGALETRESEGAPWRAPLEYDLYLAKKAVVVGFPEIATIGNGEVVEAVREVAMASRANPPKDYLLSLAWDGVPRLATWLHVAFGTPDDRLHADMGSNWLKGLAKRVLHPGCQFDEVLVLEGAQGIGKTRALRAIGGEWHVELTVSAEERDFYMALASNILVEFSEGDIVGRTSVRKLKALITKTKDQWRPPYERGMVNKPRGCVFAMTTNDGDYQKDETGGRRWLPIEAVKADVAWIEANRDQLLAEAVHRVEEGRESTHEYDVAIHALRLGKTEDDPIREPIMDWYGSLAADKKAEGVRMEEVFVGGLKAAGDASWFAGQTLDRKMEYRIASVLKLHLGLDRKVVRRDGKIVRRWL